MKAIISDSKKFKVEFQSLEMTDSKHCNVKLSDKNDNIIHEYIERGISSPLNQFVTINGQEWWIGGRHYMLKLFVNCETGQVFDDPDKREFSNAYKSGHEFIWAGDTIVSPNGNYLMVVGCIWACPYEYRLYDIHNLIHNVTTPEHPDPDKSANETDSHMIREIPLHRHLREKDDFPEDDPRYEASENWLGDDEVFIFEFVTDNEITIKYRDGKEKKYYNTIDLPSYPAV